MLWGTHICVPLMAALVRDLHVAGRGQGTPLARWQYGAVALAGVLPDVVDPHLFLDDRWRSWSHSVWFLAAVMAVSAPIFLRGAGRQRAGVALWLLVALAVAAHLAGDAVSGGIAPYWPLDGRVVGAAWIPPPQWPALDLAAVLGALLLWAALRWRRAR